MKLPKQRRHWCKISGLKPVSRPRKAWSWHTLKGCGYLSLPLPQNKDEFMDAYLILWSQARKSEVK